MVCHDRDLNVGTTGSSSDNITFPPPRHRLHLGVFAESVSDNAVMTEMCLFRMLTFTKMKIISKEPFSGFVLNRSV